MFVEFELDYREALEKLRRSEKLGDKSPQLEYLGTSKPDQFVRTTPELEKIIRRTEAIRSA